MATAPTQIRIDAEVKKQAGDLFEELGLDMSGAVNLFLRQCILRGGLPFAVEVPARPLDMSRMTAAQLDAELEKGYRDAQSGNTVPAEEAFADLRREYGL